MRTAVRSAAWQRGARFAALAVVIVALAGCATGYQFVQPDAAAAGGYYTSSEPYSGQGYYDDYGTGPYYPGTAGFGYYNGTAPYSGFGWLGGFGYGVGFGGYWPQFSLGIGLSNVWGFPGYWGPWYSTFIPFYGCRDCGYRRHHQRWQARRGRAGNQRPWTWTHADRPGTTRWTRGNVAATSPPSHWQQHGFAAPMVRRPLASASFAPHGIDRAPFGRGFEAGLRAPMARPVYRPMLPPASAYWRGRAAYVRGAASMMSPHAGGVVARPAFHAQPMRAVPAASPSSYQGGTARTRVH